MLVENCLVRNFVVRKFKDVCYFVLNFWELNLFWRKHLCLYMYNEWVLVIDVADKDFQKKERPLWREQKDVITCGLNLKKKLGINWYKLDIKCNKNPSITYWILLAVTDLVLLLCSSIKVIYICIICSWSSDRRHAHVEFRGRIYFKLTSE